MNHRLIDALMKGLAPVIQEYVAETLRGLLERIEKVEAHAPIPGEKGEPGQPGEPGKDGVDGKDGRDGVDGKDGTPGERGEPGLPGERGLDGLTGERGGKGDPGEPGSQGKDGSPGRDGLAGVPGRDGKDGAAGRDGQDGFGLDDFDLKAEDGGRTLVFTFQREGKEPIVRSVKTAMPIHRGIYKEGREYEAGDSVVWGGSTFVATRGTSARPETADCGWQLSTKRGRDGKDGKNGDKGIPGPKGEKGDPGPRVYTS